jgi:hypothetical protein
MTRSLPITPEHPDIRVPRHPDTSPTFDMNPIPTPKDLKSDIHKSIELIIGDICK